MSMKAANCEQRDGYLGKWLTGDELVEFEAHLAYCRDCRQIIQEEQRLESLLARANSALAPVPPALIDRVEHRLRQAGRRSAAAWATGLAAAALLICAVAIWHLPQRVPEDGPVPSPVAAQAPRPAELAHARRPLVEVTFHSPSDVIAVPQKTENPSVTIIWVYPTIKAEQDPSPEPSDLFQPPERNGI
jgi:hypothetical protein